MHGSKDFLQFVVHSIMHLCRKATLHIEFCNFFNWFLTAEPLSCRSRITNGNEKRNRQHFQQHRHYHNRFQYVKWRLWKDLYIDLEFWAKPPALKTKPWQVTKLGLAAIPCWPGIRSYMNLQRGAFEWFVGFQQYFGSAKLSTARKWRNMVFKFVLIFPS